MNKLDSVLGALSWTILFLAISDYFHVLTFVLSYYIFLLSLRSQFSNERHIRGRCRYKGQKGETWWIRGRGRHNQDILYERKISIFNKIK